MECENYEIYGKKKKIKLKNIYCLKKIFSRFMFAMKRKI